MDEFVVSGRRGWHGFLMIAHLLVAVGFGYWAYTYGPVELWAIAGSLVLIAVLHLIAVIKAATPIFVADDQGVRLRAGKQWVGLLWSRIVEIRVEPSTMTKAGHITIVSEEDNKIFTIPVGAATTASAVDAQVELSARYSLAR